MRTVDLSPLYRSFVGVDRMIDLIDAASRADAAGGGYPPYNIEETGEDAYRIELAVAGFGEDDLDVTVEDALLVISGKKENGDERRYLHRGIAERAFERRFNLAEHVIVTGAKLENGLLVVDLRREIPDSAKPRRIAIASKASRRKVIEGESAKDKDAA